VVGKTIDKGFNLPKIVFINVPSLFVILVGKSTTCDRLYVFIKIKSFDAALLFARRIMFRLPHGCKKLFRIFSNSLRKRLKLPVGALYIQKIINFRDLKSSLTAHIANVFS
jgi:hypothetical protein